MSSSPLPIPEFQEAVRQFASRIGCARPVRAIIETEDGEQIPISLLPVKAARQSRNARLVLQAIRQAREPLQAQEIEQIVDRGHTTVTAALKELRDAGLVVKTGRDGFKLADRE